MKSNRWIILAIILGIVASGVLITINILNGATTSDVAAGNITAGEDTAQITGTSDTTLGTPVLEQNASTQSNEKVFTLDQLKAANGKNGAPAYIAYHGKVYDLAGVSEFVNGVHIYDPNIKAGMDLTELFDKTAPNSHRANNYISKLKEIGVLSTGIVSSGTDTGTGGSKATDTVSGTSSTATGTQSPAATESNPATTTTKPSMSTTDVKKFTVAQLKAANGINGTPAYIAYHGKVYDLSGDPAFVNGVHKYDKNIRAGMDLTDLFDNQAPGSHRANDYISRLTQVGVLDTDTGSNGTGTGTGTKGSPSTTTKPAGTTTEPSTPTTNTKTFTEAQLKAANGINGAPAYIAYHGKVYDLSGDPAFVNGVHKYDKNIRAGMDLTNLFDNQAPGSHRANNYISRLTQVGVMDAAYTGPAPAPATGGSKSDDDSEEVEDD